MALPECEMASFYMDIIGKKLGLDIRTLRRVVIDLRYGDAVIIFIELIGSKEMLSFDFAELMEGANIKVVGTPARNYRKEKERDAL